MLQLCFISWKPVEEEAKGIGGWGSGVGVRVCRNHETSHPDRSQQQRPVACLENIRKEGGFMRESEGLAWKASLGMPLKLSIIGGLERRECSVRGLYELRVECVVLKSSECSFQGLESVLSRGWRV